jgi:hypothetical protein
MGRAIGRRKEGVRGLGRRIVRGRFMMRTMLGTITTILGMRSVLGRYSGLRMGRRRR